LKLPPNKTTLPFPLEDPGVFSIIAVSRHPLSYFFPDSLFSTPWDRTMTSLIAIRLGIKRKAQAKRTWISLAFLSGEKGYVQFPEIEASSDPIFFRLPRLYSPGPVIVGGLLSSLAFSLPLFWRFLSLHLNFSIV